MHHPAGNFGGEATQIHEPTRWNARWHKINIPWIAKRFESKRHQRLWRSTRPRSAGAEGSEALPWGTVTLAL